jgi:hypothetical protein
MQMLHVFRECEECGEGKRKGKGLSDWRLRFRMIGVTLEEQEERMRMRILEEERRRKESKERIAAIVQASREREESSRKTKREDLEVESGDEVVQTPPWMRMRLAPPLPLRSGVVGRGNSILSRR